jgi:UDP-glucose 4-epimerase
MINCLVTGGAGFIGSHLVEHLLARNHRVRVLDNLMGGTIDNLSRVAPAIEFYQGDLADLDLVRRVMQGVEFVFHLAAAPEPFQRLAHFGPAIQADVVGTQHLLSAACEVHVRRLIYASSLRVYGPTSGAICLENPAPQPLEALSPEGITKALGEKACVDCTRDYGLETVRLRYFNVFGSRQPPQSPYAAVVAQALEAMLAGRSPVLDGDGFTPLDLVSVGDVVYASLTAMEAPRLSGKAYNIGNGRWTTARDVIAAINAILSTRIEPTFTGPRPLTDLDNRADVARAEAELGFCAGEDLVRGLRSCVQGVHSWSGRPHLGRFDTAAKHNPANELH